jgi:hypothetical protein
VDGVTIITSKKSEFLHIVPEVTQSIFGIGSTTPGALLYDALDHYEKKSPKADENIRNIMKDLPLAVNACIQAAGHESNPTLQRNLLKAAAFGKCFLDDYDSSKFVEMCRVLRVLNAINHFEIGIPMTYQQYILQTPSVLIDRLMDRHHHLLAFRICEYLKMKSERVLVHWACMKVKTTASDADISDLIVRKLENVPGISYAEIASTAYRTGRRELATMLLEYEPRAADQVPLLISMEQDELALLKAIESGDTDLGKKRNPLFFSFLLIVLGLMLRQKKKKKKNESVLGDPAHQTQPPTRRVLPNHQEQACRAELAYLVLQTAGLAAA